MTQIENLIKKKDKLEKEGKFGTVEYIRCLANINYFVADKDKSKIDNFITDNDMLSPDNFKLIYEIGLEQIFGSISKEMCNLVGTALDYMLIGDFKGYCLMKAIISGLCKRAGDINE